MHNQTGLFDVLPPDYYYQTQEQHGSLQSLPSLDSRHKVIGLDCETTGKDKWTDKPCGVAISLEDGTDHYIGYGHQGGGNHDPEKVRQWLRSSLKDRTLVNLNISFDSEVLRNDGVDLEQSNCTVVDVGHNAGLLNEHRYSGFSLDSLGREYVQRGKQECPVRPSDIWRQHSSVIAPYARGDSRLALDIFHAQLPLIKAESLEKVAELESRLIYVVNEMERNGTPLDVEKCARWRMEIRDKLERMQLDLYGMTGIRVNPNSPNDMLRLFKQLGLEYVDNQAETLKRVNHPAIKLALSIKQLDSLRNKYIDKYFDLARNTGLLRYTLHQLRGDEYGTITGRFSSSGGKERWGINVQQVFKPSKQRKRLGPDYIIRELMIPAKGRLWVSSDAAQIEFRLFAAYAKNPMMMAAYAKDKWTDFYAFVVTLLKEAADYTILRDDSKVLNLAKIYGMGMEKQARSLGIDEETNVKINNAYNRAFPEARKLMNKAMRVAEERGYVKTFLGRRGRFPEKKNYHSALNKVLQGTAADIMKLKLCVMYYEMRKEFDLTMRSTVHDEANSDAPMDIDREKYEARMNEQMLDLDVPILWETGYGHNWMEAGD